MKKTYISPKMDVIKIMSQRMLADSNKIPTSGDDVKLNPETMSGGDGSGAASREYISAPDAWDEW